jgi:hypothetical protein
MTLLADDLLEGRGTGTRGLRLPQSMDGGSNGERETATRYCRLPEVPFRGYRRRADVSAVEFYPTLFDMAETKGTVKSTWNPDRTRSHNGSVVRS